jgi:hypothetical protein
MGEPEGVLKAGQQFLRVDIARGRFTVFFETSDDCQRYFTGLFGSSAGGLANFASSTGTFCFISLT